MKINQRLKLIGDLFSRHQESVATMIVAFPGVLCDAFAEYATYGYSSYFVRDLGYLSLMILCFLLFKLDIIKIKDVFKIPVYTIVIGQMISVLFRIQNPAFHFESYFLKAELIFALMMYGIGSLVHIKHIVLLLMANTIFIVCCYFMVPEFPVLKLIFYFVLVSSSALMVYFSQGYLLKIYRKLKAANLIITIKNEELSQMNTAKDQLFRIIGHDLKTPFHQVKSLVELLQNTTDSKEREEINTMLSESITHGNTLLEDLLKWSHSYKKGAEVQVKQQPVKPIIDKILDYLRLKFEQKNIEIVNAIGRNVTITCNAQMMEAVFRNLLSNAIKFSYRNSSIQIQSILVGDVLEIIIQDKGAGMSKNQLKQLFSSFQNISTLGTSNEKGSGHGLNIVKELVEKQGGHLKIDSKHKKGTRVSLYFPKIKEAV